MPHVRPLLYGPLVRPDRHARPERLGRGVGDARAPGRAVGLDRAVLQLVVSGGAQVREGGRHGRVRVLLGTMARAVDIDRDRAGVDVGGVLGVVSGVRGMHMRGRGRAERQRSRPPPAPRLQRC